MDSPQSPSLNKMQLDDTEDQQMQNIWELCKIGSFDMDSWNKVFENLSDEELANVALVCKDFQTMAKDIIAHRYKDESFCVSFAENGWKPVICRFSDVISDDVTIAGRERTITQEEFSYFERFISGTVRKLTFHGIDTKQWKDIVIRRKFEKLELLAFVMCDLSVQCRLFMHLNYWYPIMKSLKFSHCIIGKNKFLEQSSLPLVEDASFHGMRGVNIDFFLIFIIKNRRLKSLFVDLCCFSNEMNMSALPIVNEVLPKLESMIWSCSNLTLLPTFRKTFDNVKELGFNLVASGTYKNELLKIIGNFPVLEELKILQIYQNLMTNDDFIDLLTQCSTLKKCTFLSRRADKEMKFGYDLHRRVCEATSNRSDIEIEFEFGWLISGHTHFVISKDSIKENGKIIVLRGSH